VKLTIPTAELLTQLQSAVRVASTRTAIQALSGVKIVADDGRALLLATDTEVGLRLPLSAEVQAPGSVVLPARLLLEVVRSLPGDTATLELQAPEQTVELISLSAKFHLRTLRSEDFPDLPSLADESRMTMPAQAFVDTAQQVSRSASRDETRPVLTGVLVSASGSELRMVATDSYRLSVKRTLLDEPLEGTIEANVPARALGELTRIVQGTEVGSLSVGLGQNQIVFELDGVMLSSRLIDGQFPNYRQLLPESVEHELPLSTAEITDVVRRVALLAQKNAPLRLSFEEGQLTVSAETPDVGEASEALPVPFSGERFEIGFNPDFLRDGLESVESEELLLKLISPLRPGLIESPQDGEFVYLIMPIRLNA
jgi:DNA polymerase III subunit beta